MSDKNVVGQRRSRGIVWRNDSEHTERRELVWELLGEIAHDSDMVELAEATTASIRQKQPRRFFRRGLGWRLAAGAAALAVGVGIWQLNAPIHHHSDSLAVNDFSTKAGEQRRVLLSDGSQLELNTATQVHVEFTDQVRRLTLLRGEALFFVKHDTRRPFEVHAGATSTRAVGTAFNILYLHDRADIAVLEGRVQVEASIGARSIQRATLSHGQAMTYTMREGLSAVELADLSRIASWQARRVEFHDVTLSSAVDDFNRYVTTRLLVLDPSLDDIRVSGVFRFDDVDAFSRALHATFGIDTRIQGRFVELVPHAAGGGAKGDP